MLNLNKNYVKKTERPHTIPAGATGQGEREKESKSRFSKLNFINAPLIKGARGILKVTLTSLIAALACTGIIYAATTVGTNITTTGTLDVTGVSTLTGDTSIAGTLDVTGNFTFTTASSTGIVKFPQINSDTGAISFGDENLTTTGDLSVANATTTGDFYATGTVKADKLRDRANIIPNTLYEDNGFDLISLRPHPKVVNPVLDKDDVTDVTANFVADPSLFYESGTWYMFFEVMTTPNSQIGYATSPDGLTWTYGAIVLSDDSIAYSYPHVFKYNGTYYMIPSTSNSVVRIYTATSFPTTWTLSETITVDGGNDPSMFQWGGKWWLLACNSGTDNGYAYYSTIGPTGGTWTAHDNNPIISADNAKCRGAGRPIVKDDYIIYFYQKGDVDYGEKVRAFKITDLTSSTFTETELTTSPVLEPSSLEQWRSVGMHTVDIWPSEKGSECLAVVDGHYQPAGSVWSIGIYECGTSGFSDDIPQEFGAGKDVIEYFDSADNEYKLDLSTNGVNVDMSISTDGDANTLFIDGTNGKVGIGVNTPTAKFNIEATNVNGFDLQTSSTLTVPSITNYGIVNALTVNSAVNDEYNFIAAINTMDIDETGGAIANVIGLSNYVKINGVAVATNYSNVFGVKTYLSRVYTNAAQTLTNYYGFDSTSLSAGGSSGAFDGTNWYHFYAEDFAAFGGTVANTYGLYVEEQTYGTNNYGIVLNGANCMHLRGTAGPKLCAGSGTPESAVIAPIGSMYMRSDGVAGTSMYVKESGTGNTGWVGK